jgi:hypothetical protein
MGRFSKPLDKSSNYRTWGLPAEPAELPLPHRVFQGNGLQFSFPAGLGTAKGNFIF